jgi:trigger factor
MNSVADLEAKLAENIKHESDAEESVRQDKKVLELLAAKSDFEPISDLLVNQEIEKMLHELKSNVNNQGAEFENYLKSINKTLADLKLDFAPTAMTRVKVAMILKEVAAAENIKPTEAEVSAELDKIAEHYKDNKEAKETLYSPQYHDYIERQMTNRKAIDYLKSVMVV